jgi:TonB family protein
VRAAPPPEKAAAKSRKRPQPKPAEQSAPAAPAVASEVPQAPDLDRLLKAHEAFRKAMSGNHLLTPADTSAKHYVAVMTQLAPDNEMTVNAQQMLFKELLSRSRQALEALDTDAARAWIDAAAGLGIDPSAVAEARNALTDKVVAMESQRPLPASALKLVSYAAPEYPRRAIEHDIEGWVDLEFTVAKDGTTREIKVTDSKNDYYFHEAAVAAVQRWRFKPRVLMGRTIDQRVFTKINFTLSDKRQ